MNAQPAQQSNAPTVMSIIAIVISVICLTLGTIVGLVLGFMAKSRATAAGQPTTLPNVAIIVAAIFLVLNIIGIIVNFTVLRH